MRPVWIVLFGAIACSGSGDSGRSAAEAAARTQPLAAREGAEAGAAPAAWTPFSRRDDVPICLFERYEDWGNAQYLRDAKQKVSFKAGRPVYIGAYGPGCADPECVRRVTLQCWADVEGKTITVSTRYSGEQQLAQPCANNCQPDAAACETPPLKAGTYTLKHGAQERTIRIPGALNPACLPGSE